jgi:hypothetical protein
MRHRCWGERAHEDLLRSSDRRQRAIARLDKIESVILTLAVTYSMATIGLAGLGIWLDRPAYYLTSATGGVLAVVLGSIKLDHHRRRMRLMQQEETYEDALRVIEAAGLVDDQKERAKIISAYAAAIQPGSALSERPGTRKTAKHVRRRKHAES